MQAAPKRLCFRICACLFSFTVMVLMLAALVDMLYFSGQSMYAERMNRKKPSHVEIRKTQYNKTKSCKALYVDGKKFEVRGINYSPVFNGTDINEWPYGDMVLDRYYEIFESHIQVSVRGVCSVCGCVRCVQSGVCCLWRCMHTLHTIRIAPQPPPPPTTHTANAPQGRGAHRHPRGLWDGAPPGLCTHAASCPPPPPQSPHQWGERNEAQRGSPPPPPTGPGNRRCLAHLVERHGCMGTEVS